MVAAKMAKGSAQPEGRFLVLPENRLAYTAVTQLLSPGPSATHPLVVLFGPSGTGKSHLAQYCAREAERLRLQERRMRMTASEFAADLIRASAAASIPEFQESYRRLQFLICEDLQALEGRSETQQQLLAVIEDILQADGRVLLTSSKSPGELQRFSARLVNRFHGGLCVAVELPGAASRKKLLREFAARQQLLLSEDVVTQLAEALPLTPRELRGVLVQLSQQAFREQRPLECEQVERFLREWQAPAGSLMKQVTQVVARAFSLKPQQLRGARRLQLVVLPRQVAMFVARTSAGQSCTQIGTYFGKHSHSTVVHACQRVEELMSGDPTLRQLVLQIQDELRQSGILCRHDVD